MGGQREPNTTRCYSDHLLEAPLLCDAEVAETDKMSSYLGGEASVSVGVMKGGGGGLIL